MLKILQKGLFWEFRTFLGRFSFHFLLENRPFFNHFPNLGLFWECLFDGDICFCLNLTKNNPKTYLGLSDSPKQQARTQHL